MTIYWSTKYRRMPNVSTWAYIFGWAYKQEGDGVGGWYELSRNKLTRNTITTNITTELQQFKQGKSKLNLL